MYIYLQLHVKFSVKISTKVKSGKCYLQITKVEKVSLIFLKFDSVVGKILNLMKNVPLLSDKNI